jgi:hypothetical protein
MLALLWLALGVAVWCGFFDLYVSRGARLYGQLHAEYELHMIRDEPSMVTVMNEAKHDGFIAASLWAGAVTLSGWATILLKGGTRSRHLSRGSL